MAETISARALKEMLHDQQEVAVVDIREHGRYGLEHPLFCTSIPFSHFELLLPQRVPNRDVRLVLYDLENGPLARRAAAIAEEMGFRQVLLLEGGLQAWCAAGYSAFAGVHVASKAFGELVEHHFGTPSMSAAELDARRRRGEPLVVLDGRPWEEYRAMNIPDSISCPNGELVWRIGELVSDDDMPIVVNCAGRTRSIIGCETLRQFGIPNPVYALRNGTMGWRLAGFELEHDSARTYDRRQSVPDLAERRRKARAMAQRVGVPFLTEDAVRGWLASGARTTYLLDVRDLEEYRQEHLQDAVSAPGGQLMQATDQWLGVRGARLVLVDAEEVRAPVCAFWLAQMGFEVAVLAGGAASWWATASVGEDQIVADGDAGPGTSVAELASAIGGADASVILLDTQKSMAYRRRHVPGARWVNRSLLETLITDAELTARPVRVVGDGSGAEALVADDLRQRGGHDVAVVEGGITAWCAAGYPVQASPDDPPDETCIDYLFFVHDRHHGNLEAAQQYLAWEQGLVERLDEAELGTFRLL